MTKPSPYETLFPLIRQHLWPPDGKPPGTWTERREGSVLKQLLRCHSVSQIECAILGLAQLRDTGEIDWLKRGAKVTTLALYHTRSGVAQMFELATTAYWRKAKQRQPRPAGQTVGAILAEAMARAKGDSFLSFQNARYTEYMRSPAWRAKRERILARANMRCEKCGDYGNGLEVHHLTYERFGKERDEDLQALCSPCHEQKHEHRQAS